MSDIVNKEKMKELTSGTVQPYLGRSMSVNEGSGLELEVTQARTQGPLLRMGSG